MKTFEILKNNEHFMQINFLEIVQSPIDKNKSILHGVNYDTKTNFNSDIIISIFEHDGLSCVQTLNGCYCFNREALDMIEQKI